MENQGPRYVTAEDAARRFNVHEQTIYSWIRRGRLKAAKFGRAVRIPVEELDRFEREGLEGTSGTIEDDRIALAVTA